MRIHVPALLAAHQAPEGQGLVEYALIVFLVSIAAILALTALGGQIVDLFTQIVAAL
jgi:Flp pilus assembly pilin Flp